MDNFDLKKFLKENKALENLNPSIKSINEGEAAYEYEKGKKEGEEIEKKKMTKEAMKKQQSPNNIGAMLMAGQLLTPKQEQAPMPSFGRVSPAQAFNVTDPVASLLAPKRKKERPMISLL